MSRGSTRAGKTPTPTEHEEQAALVEWWGLYARWKSLPPSLLMAIPNGGYRSAITGARLKAEGVRVGIPDLFLAVPTRQAHGLWIEMKRQHGGRISDAQKSSMVALEAQGYACTVCRGWAEARRSIVEYLGGDIHVDA